MMTKLNEMMLAVDSLQDRWETAVAVDDLVLVKELEAELADINAAIDEIEKEL